MALCYKKEPQRRGFSSLTPCPQNGAHVLPYCEGGGPKKPSESVYIYTHTEQEQSFLHWVCPGLCLYFPVISWDISDGMVLGVSTNQGVCWTLLSQIGRGQRKTLCFLCRSQAKQLLPVSPWSRRGNKAFSSRQTGEICGLSSSFPSCHCSRKCITFPEICWCESLSETTVHKSSLWRVSYAGSPSCHPQHYQWSPSDYVRQGSEIRLLKENALIPKAAALSFKNWWRSSSSAGMVLRFLCSSSKKLLQQKTK